MKTYEEIIKEVREQLKNGEFKTFREMQQAFEDALKTSCNDDYAMFIRAILEAQSEYFNSKISATTGTSNKSLLSLDEQKGLQKLTCDYLMKISDYLKL